MITRVVGVSGIRIGDVLLKKPPLAVRDMRRLHGGSKLLHLSDGSTRMLTSWALVTVLRLERPGDALRL
jgi:hypothetical protein